MQKFISLTIFIMLSYEGLYDFAFLDESFGTNFKSRVRKDGKIDCLYNHAGYQLSKLAFTEIFVFSVVQIGKTLFYYIVFK